VKKMNRSRLAEQVLLCAVTALSACTIEIGPLDESGATVEDTPPGLPEPTGHEPVPLDEAKRAKKAEVDRHIASVVYQGATITHTIQLPSGDIIDGLDRTTLPSLPYALPLLPWAQDGQPLPPGVEPGLFDFQQYPELLELITVAAPFVRPTITGSPQACASATEEPKFSSSLGCASTSCFRMSSGTCVRGMERIH
jgi:hypothetical protein